MARLRTLRRVYGLIDQPLQRLLSRDIDDAIEETLIAAAASWKTDGLQRFNDEEANCTIQLYRWGDEAIRKTSTLHALSLQLEWVQPTPEMLAGKEDAGNSSRPDLRFSIGSVGRTVECKRLTARSPWLRRYVYEGMDRFVSGVYAPSEDRGNMVGYMQADEPTTIVDGINTQVAAHPAMGSSHKLVPSSARPPIQDVFRSTHIRKSSPSILLTHYLVDLR